MNVNETYDVNWDAINADVEKQLATGKYGVKQPSVWLKLTPGVHTLRIVPSGNATEKLPYLKLIEHSFSTKDEASGKPQFGSILCWRYLLDNLTSKKTDQEKAENSLISFLGAQRLLDQENYKKYMEFGCPWCQAHSFLNMHGVEQEVRSKFWGREAYFWNVIWRRTEYTGDDKVYIWRQSKGGFNTVINSIKIAKMARSGENYIDVNAGRDLMIQATGNGLQRRYPVIQFVGDTSPLNLGDQTAHSLDSNVVSKGFKTYQDAVNLLKQCHGKVLMAQGHQIKGDQVISQQYQTAVQVLNTPIQPTANQVLPGSIPVVQVPDVIDPSFMPGDTVVVGANGKLVNSRTGKEMF
jgi:hypothetical protein